MKRSVPFLFVLFLAFTAELFAQGVGASGDISGTSPNILSGEVIAHADVGTRA